MNDMNSKCLLTPHKYVVLVQLADALELDVANVEDQLLGDDRVG